MNTRAHFRHVLGRPNSPRQRLFLAVSLAWMVFSTALSIEAAEIPPVHHQLHIELHPDTHTLQGVDRIHLLPGHRTDTSVTFSLHSGLTIDRIEYNGQSLTIPESPAPAASSIPATRRTVDLPLPASLPDDQPAILTLAYHGMIDDTPTASGGLRFVRPDDTDGHIGPDGIYLTYETFWYPVWEHTLATFDVTVSLPSGWEAVTQGSETANSIRDNRRISEWKVTAPSEALTLAANRFVVHTREWNEITLAAYLFPEEAHLAPQYLEAIRRYLEMYTALLGPYPFSKFAVVENFFPSGLGLPSFTLLGQGVVRRGYTQPYSLGHEIVHSWFGNSVFNDFDTGNWVEGLTTYLANYYYDEAMGHQQEASATRRRMVHEYNLYAAPETDYPVGSFHHKETRLDNAIGYQKSAMVFHMLRQEIGDEAFFQGLRRLIQEETGKHPEWETLLRIFSRTAGKDLDWFFSQWIDRPGAPHIRIEDLQIERDPAQPEQMLLRGTVLQPEPFFRIQLPLHVHINDGPTEQVTITVDRPRHPFTLHLPGNPTHLEVDPAHHLLLRIPRAQLPPMLNRWETAPRQIFIRPVTMTEEEEESLATLFRRVESQAGIDMIQSDHPDLSEPASYLIVGSSARHLLMSGSLKSCQPYLDIQRDRLFIKEQAYPEAEMAFLISCPHPDDPSHTVSLFFGKSPEAVAPIARLLFFYGWESYLVFQKGQVIARGMFQPVHSAFDIILTTP